MHTIHLCRVGQEGTDVLVLRIKSGQFPELMRLAEDRTAVIVTGLIFVVEDRTFVVTGLIFMVDDLSSFFDDVGDKIIDPA